MSDLLPFLVFGGLAALFLRAIFERNRAAARRQPRAHLPSCMGFDLSLAASRWRAQSGAGDAEAARIEREFRRWFALVAASPVPLGMNSRQVDGFWHELLTCTALYRDYCEAVAGRFIDHDPKGGSATGAARSWVAYRTAYGRDPDPAIWPRPLEAMIRTESVLSTLDPAVARAGAGTLRLHYPKLQAALRKARGARTADAGFGCSAGSVVETSASGDGGGCGGDGGGCGGGGGD